jgi:type I restriction enzyme R subunit
MTNPKPIPVGQKERAVQKRVVELFRDRLGYDYLGDWHERENNRAIERDMLASFLSDVQGYDDEPIRRALFQLEQVAGNQSASLFDVNREVYGLLRYGVNVSTGAGEHKRTVELIDWKNPSRNHFAIAEEVTVAGQHKRRPDLVLYVNGLAIGLIELKRSTVSIGEGIRQAISLRNPLFIRPFFAAMQLVMAGNDTEGLHYATTQTPQKFWLRWQEEGVAPDPAQSPLDQALTQLCNKDRIIELLHDFILFDSGTKKTCRHNQFFGIKAAQAYVKRREGGIIWHTQGSGKSLTMVWLAKWIRENIAGSRVLIITDRTELDEQIEGVFVGVGEEIYRTKSGTDLIAQLNDTIPPLICSLVHKFGGKEDDEAATDDFIAELKKAIPSGFAPKGDLYVFVDECHRTQSGKLNAAMKAILPDALFLGFTGTPLLKKDKQTSMEVFGPFIHTYRYDEGVRDGVVLDLLYEARDIDQEITSPEKIDKWFEAKTAGLSDLAKAQVKEKWGTMRKVMSSKSRLEKIVQDIVMDFGTRDRLMSGRGNAILVSDSIYNACRYYELFQQTPLKDECAIVTSYEPTPADIKSEDSGEGLTEKLRHHSIYTDMLAGKTTEEFEKAAKKKFIEEPGQMRLLIVVAKLLTGFDAPSATYLYLDKQLADHGLFQAICRVNRLDGDDKDYGYIIDYKDLFKSLERSMSDYTSEAFDAYAKEDVEGLLTNRLEKAQQRLTDALETIRALCEPVAPPRDTPAFLHFFCGGNASDKDGLKETEPKRLGLYQCTAKLIRAYANIANEMGEAGYDTSTAQAVLDEVTFYEKVRNEVKLASGDFVDLKLYEPAMRHLIDAYIRAEESEKISEFDDMTLIQLIVERGEGAIDALPEGIKGSQEAVAETIENNVRKLIIDETPVNPRYYEQMSQLLDDLIEERRTQAINYEKYLAKILELANKVATPQGGKTRPPEIDSPEKIALFDYLDDDAPLAVAIDAAIRAVKKDDWRGNLMKEREIKRAIRQHVDDAKVEDIFDLVKGQHGY